MAPHFRRIEEIFDARTLAELHDFADVAWGRDGAMPRAEFDRQIRTAQALVFGTWSFGRDAVSRAGPDLELILEVAGSHRHPDLDYATCFDRGIPVGSCAPAFGPVVAEMALALTLSATRETAAGDRAFRAGRERYLEDGNQKATTLYDKTVGFVGCGGLTRSLQPLLAPFRLRMLGFDPWLGRAQFEQLAIEPTSLEDLFDRSHVLFVMAVPTAENREMIDRSLMERLGPTDVLVVASRAHLVDYVALGELVVAGRFKAAVDVYPNEPLAADDPLRSIEGLVHSAHRAGGLPEALQEIGRLVVADLRAVFVGSAARRMQYATPEMIAGLGD